MRLYLAGPLFNQTELAFNARLAAAIEEMGYDVYLPQRDGLEPEVVDGPITGSIAQQIFDLDLEQVFACDVLLCVLDGRVPDEGTAVEIGLAHADRMHEHHGRVLIGYTTDRRHELGAGLNAMLLGALDEVYTDEVALLERLRSLLVD
jgi:nucleoside 2-deoxyribosyltransferase